MLRGLKARINASNDRWLAQFPAHERDQIEEAAKTNWGTLREWWKMRTGKGMWKK